MNSPASLEARKQILLFQRYCCEQSWQTTEMDQSPSSTSEDIIHHSASYQKSSPQGTAVLPFKNITTSKNNTIAQISSEGTSSADVLTRNPAENIAVAAGITVTDVPDSAYNSENENSPEQQISSQSLERKVTVNLPDKKIWKKFYLIGNEMIVTKPGR